MGTRRVRTDRGVKRFDKPIGAVIGGRRLVNVKTVTTSTGVRRARAGLSVEDAPRRSTTGSRAQHVQSVRTQLKELDAKYDRYGRGQATSKERRDLEYASPTARRKAVRETGSYLRPKEVQREMVRGRKRGGRDVTFNRLSGKYVATDYHSAARVDRADRFRDDGAGIAARRPGRTGSAMRAKQAQAGARKAPKIKPYVGRRRRED